MEIPMIFKMFNNYSKEIERLMEENQKLLVTVNDQNQKIKALTKEQEDTSKSECVLDFSKIRVFSVERYVGEGDKPCTLIGYLLSEPVTSSDGTFLTTKDVVCQWYLYCSPQRHEEIVREYKRSLK